MVSRGFFSHYSLLTTHYSLLTVSPLPRRHRFGRHAENFEHHRGADQCGGPAWIEWRRDLDDIAADQVEATQFSDHDLRLDDGHSATFRRAGAGRKGRIEAVDIEAHIGRAAADDRPGLFDHGIRAFLVKFLHRHDPHAAVPAEFPHVTIVERSANTDLNGPLGIKQAFLDCPAERRA